MTIRMRFTFDGVNFSDAEVQDDERVFEVLARAQARFAPPATEQQRLDANLRLQRILAERKKKPIDLSWWEKRKYEPSPMRVA